MLYQTENPHGGDLYSRRVDIDFSANINPFGTPEAVKEALRGSADLLCNYPDPYCRELTAAIADFEQLPQHTILCGNGAAELIFSFCMAYKPRRALLTAPSFSEYATALEAVDCPADYYYLLEQDNFAVTEDFLSFLSRWDGDLLMLCNPNNPTGQVIARPLMDKILALCAQRNIFLFVDECFLDLTEQGEPLSLKSELLHNPAVFLLKAFTKSYGMAGLRLGYCLCGNPSLLQKMGRLVQPWNVSIPAQKAGVAALRQTEFLRQANLLICRERQIQIDALRDMGLKVIPSRTNYILFHSPRELRQPLLERGIQIRSCANYPGLTQGWYRIAVKRPEQNEALRSALREVLYG